MSSGAPRVSSGAPRAGLAPVRGCDYCRSIP